MPFGYKMLHVGVWVNCTATNELISINTTLQVEKRKKQPPPVLIGTLVFVVDVLQGHISFCPPANNNVR